MSFKKQTKYLKKIEGSAFFNHVRGHTTVALYDHKEVWKIFGYEGESFSKGGYIKRGFNDLDWLPEPRVTEHPDLAKFMGTEKSQYANIKLKSKVNEIKLKVKLKCTLVRFDLNIGLQLY